MEHSNAEWIFRTAICNKLQPNTRHKNQMRSCLPIQYSLRAITFLHFAIYFRYRYAVYQTATYSAGARCPQCYVSKAFAGFVIHLCGFYSYKCVNFRADRLVPEMVFLRMIDDTNSEYEESGPYDYLSTRF